MQLSSRKTLTEEGFLQEPLGKEYFAYARNSVGSMINKVELKWNPGRAGISLDEFVMDTSISAIELARKDLKKGLLRRENENSFKNFFWFRILKTFYEKLNELKDDPLRGEFDERLGKYYEGTAVDFGPADENDDTVFGTGERPPKKQNTDVTYFYYSTEKALALEENHKVKMSYVRRIREIVAKMSPADQRLFNLKYQFDFTESDYKMWETISTGKHVKDPFTKMAHEKYGISEGYAKKRICLIKADILKQLKNSGHTPERYRERTSVPMLEMLVVRRPVPEFDFDIDNLSEADCRDILMELYA